ncbi:MAG: prepilin-type N-terminal cleavage/methylation protein [Phycisphaerales bacterium]|nr:prepilin-type N-terminal cleavage/methylation protein [Phycisphaerales bacterium]
MKNTTGFTLIELSIVLVIIGLIIGGVLAGKDLINAANLRATISQKEKFDTAVNTFRGKFNCLPGDCKNAVSFGLGANGDGDGQVGLTAAVYSGQLYNGTQAADTTWTELGDFWIHLSKAKLIDGSFNLVLPSTNFFPVGGVNSPATKIGNNTAWWLMSDMVVPSLASIGYWTNGAIAGRHVYWLTAMIWPDMAGAAGLKALDAYNIDVKLDDGLPLTGNVRAADNYSSDGGGPSQSFGLGAAGTPSCVNTTPAKPVYNINATETGSDCANDISSCNRCGLVLGASF